MKKNIKALVSFSCSVIVLSGTMFIYLVAITPIIFFYFKLALLRKLILAIIIVTLLLFFYDLLILDKIIYYNISNRFENNFIYGYGSGQNRFFFPIEFLKSSKFNIYIGNGLNTYYNDVQSSIYSKAFDPSIIKSFYEIGIIGTFLLIILFLRFIFLNNFLLGVLILIKWIYFGGHHADPFWVYLLFILNCIVVEEDKKTHDSIRYKS